ncbi:MAG: arginine--tRNA ligase [bacterium]
MNEGFFSLKKYLQALFLEVLQTLDFKTEIKFSIDRSPVNDFHYGSNVLLILKKSNVNQDFINRFISKVSFCSFIDKVEVINGFLNIKFSKDVFKFVLNDFIVNNLWNSYKVNNERILIEFVSANPTGPLNAVNGRAASFGLVLSNVLKYFGNYVFKEYYVNDVGEQIEKLIDSVIQRIREVSNLDFNIPEDGYKGEYLRDFAIYLVNKFGINKDNIFEFLNNRELIYKETIDYFVNSHISTLKRFGVVFDNFFKQNNIKQEDLLNLINFLKEKGLVYNQDDAILFKSTLFGDDKDRVLRKSVGKVEYTYFAYDIEYIRNKFNRKFNKLITILGPDHHGYVNRLKSATSALGYDPNNHEIIVLQIVNVVMKDKALKMSKRKGILVLLDELMDNVNPDILRFFFLSRLKDSPLELDLELMNKLTLENPLYYIQYVYARINGILRNFYNTDEIDIIKELNNFMNLLNNEVIDDEELKIFLQGVELRDHIYSALSDPYYLVLWAYNFAKSFHQFYNANKILCENELGKDKQNIRLVLVLFFKALLELWASFLNITLPKKM